MSESTRLNRKGKSWKLWFEKFDIIWIREFPGSVSVLYRCARGSLLSGRRLLHLVYSSPSPGRREVALTRNTKAMRIYCRERHVKCAFVPLVTKKMHGKILQCTAVSRIWRIET